MSSDDRTGSRGRIPGVAVAALGRRLSGYLDAVDRPTRGKEGIPYSDAADPPRRRADRRRGHGTFANDRPPIAGVVGREPGEFRSSVVTLGCGIVGARWNRRRKVESSAQGRIVLASRAIRPRWPVSRPGIDLRPDSMRPGHHSLSGPAAKAPPTGAAAAGSRLGRRHLPGAAAARREDDPLQAGTVRGRRPSPSPEFRGDFPQPSVRMILVQGSLAIPLSG